MILIDSSVAAKWFFPEDGSEAARALIAAGDVLAAPDLIFAEVCSTAWKKARKGEIEWSQASSALAELPDILDEILPSSALAGRALILARELKHPVYDCFYLALAEQRDAVLVTADARLLAGIARTPYARLARSLSQSGTATGQ